MIAPSRIPTLRIEKHLLGVLLLVYVLSALAHIGLLWNAFAFPHVSSDEVQYIMTGESIRLSRGFDLRGEFNSSAPPVFPFLIALAHSIGSAPRVSMFCLSAFLMCSVVFPIFAIAKLVGLESRVSLVLAAGASLLPHTFYIATYMTEVVQYPLYMVAFYLGLRWLDVRSWRMDIALGAMMGLLLLTKLQGSQFVAAFILTAMIGSFHLRLSGGSQVRSFAMHSCMVLAVTLVLRQSWTLYGASHGGTALGTYGTILADQGLPHWTVRLTLAYFADFLLAPGLVTAVPVLYWMRRNGNYLRTTFVLMVFAVQIVAISTLDGGLTGWLRERLFLYALPLMAILATRGMVDFKKYRTIGGTCVLLGVPLALLGILMAYPFANSSVIEVPWANALGSLGGLVSFSRLWMTLAASGLSLALGAVLLRARASTAPIILAVYLAGFSTLALVSSSLALAQWQAKGFRTVGPILSWLSANGVQSGDRVLIAGRHAYFESASRRLAPEDLQFLDWNWRLGLGELLEWQIEAIGRYDVRMIPAPGALAVEGHAGDYFLTTAAFNGMSLKSFSYPLYLYRIGPVPNAPAPRYVTHIPAAMFSTATGRRGPGGIIVGTGTQSRGYLVYGPDQAYSPGTYRATFDFEGPKSDAVLLDIADQAGRIYASENTTLEKAEKISFSIDSVVNLEFRVVGKSLADFHFEGVDLQRVSGSIISAPTPMSKSISTTAFEGAPPAALHGLPRSPGGTCYVDSINNRPPAVTVSALQGSALEMVGWAAEPDGDASADQVYVELSSQTGEVFWAKGDPMFRPDVAKALGRPSLSDSGFTLSADPHRIPAGTYSLKIVLVDKGHVRECDLKRYLELN